ncbi:Protein AF-10 ALL1-fused protein [Collichthys lucidus]|uniref:Protein AF-10 ALL1-fused protein n=1 Tax=Collichthys lucidus TaxID=240159 RepID=A0A4U5VI30_COLLU|nr:Protein AF-10 ALL1-fused protein [Collichthys lucidus]
MSRQHPLVASCPGPAWWRNATDASTKPGLLLPASAGSTPLWTAAGRGMVSGERCLAADDEFSTCNMKEMIGGCCVCSDERGWAENPLVYCDGHGCNVAVHQACYGIVQVPTGPWFCRKCESQERAARVRCELCPHKDGALKRTDNGDSWRDFKTTTCPHFTPAASPPSRPLPSSPCPAHQVKGSAQFAGLLCEEQGSDADNVKYCGYCKYHHSKLWPIDGFAGVE